MSLVYKFLFLCTQSSLHSSLYLHVQYYCLCRHTLNCAVFICSYWFRVLYTCVLCVARNHLALIFVVQYSLYSYYHFLKTVSSVHELKTALTKPHPNVHPVTCKFFALLHSLNASFAVYLHLNWTEWMFIVLSGLCYYLLCGPLFS